MASKVAIIIPNKHKSASYRNIILTNRSRSGEPLWYYCINLNYVAYMMLYYVLLFPYGDPS